MTGLKPMLTEFDISHVLECYYTILVGVDPVAQHVVVDQVSLVHTTHHVLVPQTGSHLSC